ncbi:MAG: 2-oxoacid:acceptor oxidoreductase family protein [Candidatus Humimicrobiaceae bacterium]
MQRLIEIRWHGRGGQGAVTASKLLAEAALSEGFYIQAFPEYGAERMGAPVRSFNRISSEVIDIHCQISNPDIVTVLDQTLLETIDVTEGIRDGGSIILNTPWDPGRILPLLQNNDDKDISLYTVDASKISLETIGKVMPNTPMVGALVKVMGLLKLKTLDDTIKKTLSKKISAPIVEANIAAAKRAYEEVKEDA